MGEIIRAETLGFCMGVRRAVDITEKILASGSGGPIYTLGPLIHNRLVMEEFRRKGVTELNDINAFTGGSVIVRAHGAPPGVLKKLEAKGAEIIDATCSRVLTSIRSARSYSEDGYHVILVGDKNHGEIMAIAGHLQHYTVISPSADVQNLPIPEKSIIIGQTTLRQRDYDAICGKIKKISPDVRIVASVCPATEKRQEALCRLLPRVDAVLIIGGRGSANTKELFETAKEGLSNSWHIEEADDLPRGIEKFERIGISAGASTPDWIIDSIERRIQTLWKQKI